MVSPNSDEKPPSTASSPESTYAPEFESQPPSSSPLPPSQQPPGYYPHAELNTKMGLMFHNWALIVFLTLIIINLIFIAIFFAVVSLFISSDFSVMFWLAEMTGVMLILYIILSILIIVFWCIGLYFTYRGKVEFGEAHTRKVKLAMNLFFTSLIIYLIYFIVLMSTMFAMIFGPAMFLQGDFRFFALTILLFETIGGIGAILLAFHIVYLVIELVDERHKKMLWTGYVLNFLGIIVYLALITSQVMMSFIYLIVMAILTMVLLLFAFILFLFCYRSAYFRIREGELKPVVVPLIQYYYPREYPPSPK